MDKKIVYVLETNEFGQKISDGLHMERVIANVQTKQKNVKFISYEDTLSKEWGRNDFLFVVHSFRDWPEDKWKLLLNKVNSHISLIVTEFIPDIELLERNFKSSKISKIVICSESIAKFFQKNLSIENTKIKYIPLLGSNIRNRPISQNPMNKTKLYPTISIPGMIGESKNYDNILNAIYLLKLKYPTVHATFLLKCLNTPVDKQVLGSIDHMIDSLNIRDNIKIITDGQQLYSKYLEYCDMIIIPSKEKSKIYYSTIIDGIKSLKPIIAPNVLFAADLCKKEAGILLYENELESEEVAESISENCSIISENREIREILAQQNQAILSNFEGSKVFPQFVNIIRKLKNSNDNSK